MGALFLVSGANPDNNTFNGVIHTHASYNGFGYPIVFDGFDADEPKPIKGFGGPKLPVKNDDEVSQAYLWIMERLNCGSITLSDNCSKLVSCINLLSSDLEYSRSDIRLFVTSALLCMKHMRLDNAIALYIVESTLVETVCCLLESFPTRGLTVDGGE